MTAGRRIALVAASDGTRSALAAYLRGAGFDVEESDTLAIGTGLIAVVTLDGDGDIATRVRGLLKTMKSRPIVVVTSKPTALKDLVANHADRLRVLPAPAFGWEVVDALRALPRSRVQ